jgi:hypothetical protein
VSKRLDKLTAALKALAAALKSVPAPSMIIGGVAVIFHGVTRFTADVDGAIWAEELDLEDFVALLAKHDIHPRTADAIPTARKYQILLLTHQPSGANIDLGLAWLPFEKEALDRSKRVSLGGARLPVASVEDLVIYKAIAWRERDRADIQRLIELHADSINFVRVRSRVREFSEAIEEPERVDEVERLIQKTLKSLENDE